MSINEHSPLQTPQQASAEDSRAEYFETGLGSTRDKLRSATRFIGRQETAKILGYAELIRLTNGCAGSIADCGVYFGGGLMNYATVLAALEPYNYQCRVIGFDTYSGDAGQSEIDLKHGVVDRTKYTYDAESLQDLRRAAEIYDLDRPLNHLPRIDFVAGDLCDTAPDYIRQNPETIFRIIHLSVNLYRPTFETIKAFYPRLTRGGILAIHGLNFTVGASQALFDAFAELELQPPSIRAIDYYPNITYLIKD
jgi:hypothetical protein